MSPMEPGPDLHSYTRAVRPPRPMGPWTRCPSHGHIVVQAGVPSAVGPVAVTAPDPEIARALTGETLLTCKLEVAQLRVLQTPPHLQLGCDKYVALILPWQLLCDP